MNNHLFYTTTILKGARANTRKDRTEALACGTGDTVRERELELRLQQLPDVRATDVSALYFGYLDDLDGAETGTVASSHVLVYN